MYTLAIYFIFFFNDTATTEIYTLSLHDALPISDSNHEANGYNQQTPGFSGWILQSPFSFKNRHVIGVPSSSSLDRKSTRLNSSHANISYAVFCLKNKNLTTSHDILSYAAFCLSL